MRKKETGNHKALLTPLDDEFFLNTDVTQIAQSLLGKYLIRSLNGIDRTVLISETEAYCGKNDRACHAYNYKKTQRTEVMFSPGGIAYVYLIYGMYSMLNVVTNTIGEPDAVLIRAVLPVKGFGEPYLNQKIEGEIIKSLNGPGRLCKTLDIDKKFNGHQLSKKPLRLAYIPGKPEAQFETGTRIGVEYAGEDALRPWRFILKNGEKYLQ